MPFVQSEARAWAYKLNIRKYSALILLIHLIDKCDDQGRVQISVSRLAKEVCYSKSTVNSNLDHLFTAKIIDKVYGYQGDGSSAPNVNTYIILFPGNDNQLPLAA